MTKTIPLQAAFQAARYTRMGHGDLFVNTFDVHNHTASSACALVMREGQSCLADEEIPAGWLRDDAERVLEQLFRDFIDGVFLFVAPKDQQFRQIEADGIQLHRARLDLLLAALDHGKQHAAGNPETEPFAHTCHQLALRLRDGSLVAIKCN